jgi:hypothetical protein
MKLYKENKMTDDFLNLDQNQLDEQWLEQPRLYHKYARRLANAKQSLEEAKAELELCRAELDREIRLNPEAFGLAKLTENIVSNTITIQERYKETQASLIEVKHKVDIYQATVTTLEHRKRALESLVTLHGQDYFSSPRAKNENAQEVMNEIEKQNVRRKRTKSKV